VHYCDAFLLQREASYGAESCLCMPRSRWEECCVFRRLARTDCMHELRIEGDSTWELLTRERTD
jgi:hypothetical protein